MAPGDGRLLATPRRNAQVMDADGFFKSGDIGIMDARAMSASSTARRHDPGVRLQRVPDEIEQVVNLHPGVLECG